MKYPLSPLPTSISVEIIRGCNLDCPMCLTQRDKGELKRMEPNLYNLILGQVSKFKIPRIRFCGDGEPTLHPILPQFVAWACDAGIKTIGVVTNGTCLKTKFLEDLYIAGLNFMAISVDAATEFTYKKIRRGKHTLAELEENIQNLLNCRDKWDWKIEIQLNFVVQHLNASEVEQFQNKWKNVVERVNILRLTSQTTSRIVEFSVLEPCPMLLKKLYVAVNGDIFPCFYFYPPILPLGNVKMNSIGRVWFQRLENMSKDQSTIFTPLCKQCSYTDQPWRPGTPILPVNMNSNAPLQSMRHASLIVNSEKIGKIL